MHYKSNVVLGCQDKLSSIISFHPPYSKCAGLFNGKMMRDIMFPWYYSSNQHLEQFSLEKVMNLYQYEILFSMQFFAFEYVRLFPLKRWRLNAWNMHFVVPGWDQSQLSIFSANQNIHSLVQLNDVFLFLFELSRTSLYSHIHTNMWS